MRTACSLQYMGGGSLSRGSLSEGSLSRGVSVQGDLPGQRPSMFLPAGRNMGPETETLEVTWDQAGKQEVTS